MSINMGEGYLLLATGAGRYLELARNLAASIRVMDPSRRICLVHNEAYHSHPDDKNLFHDCTVLPDDPLYPGFMGKIRLFGSSPYDRTMFVDADCLLMKSDVDRWWQQARTKPFAITGKRRTSGEWKGADVAQLLEQEGASYLVQMNSGVFYFDRSPEAAKFFIGLNDFYRRRHDFLGIGLHRGKPAQTTEIYIGLWMGLNGMDAITSRFGENAWMVSTWRAFFYRFAPFRNVSVMRKPRRSMMGIPNPLLGWNRLSPSFVHFIGLKPRRHYEKLAVMFRAKATEMVQAH